MQKTISLTAVAAALVSLMFMSTSAFAETLYVTDILRLGIHKNPDTSDKAFKLLVSGDALEVLERNGSYARVTTTEGEIGWVKTSYLVEEKPTQALLLELTNDRERLNSEVANLQSLQSEHDAALQAVSSERDRLKQLAGSSEARITELLNSSDYITKELAAKRFSIPVQWLVVTGVLALLGGFAGGWYWTDARQRARHGGYRI